MRRAFEAVALFSPGAMGGAVGAALAAGGRRVSTVTAGRSEETRARARDAGLIGHDSVASALADADLVLSILPPARAESVAAECAAAMASLGRKVPYAECNAVAPETTHRIAATLALGNDFIDAGIIGGPPRPGGPGTRLYVSGPRAEELRELEDLDRGLWVRPLGTDIGSASAMKMSYAALTKGTMTLQAAVLMLAQRHGLFAELTTELQESQPDAWKRTGILPFLPADAGRWIGEMEEIASTFRSAGLPGGFHDGAASVYRAMAATPFAAETRATIDRSRTLEDAVIAFVEAMDRIEEGS